LGPPPDNVPFFRLVTVGLNGDTATVPRAKFVGEAALIARAVGLIAHEPDHRLDAVVAALEDELNSSSHMSLADNSLRAADMLYPYAALHGRIRPIPYYETWLDEFVRRRPAFPDRPDYRTCEDEYILYMAGRGKLPVFRNEAWSGSQRQVHDFNTEQCYCLTHRYIYATDMGQSDVGIGWVVPALLIVVGKATLWGNFDLFYEAAFCLLSADPSRQTILLVDSLSEAFLPELQRMQAQLGWDDVYHELLVYSLFRLRRDRIGGSETRDRGGLGGILTEFVNALGSKSPERIVRAHHDLGAVSPHSFFGEVCLEKLTWLKDMARLGVLFENEIMRSGMEAAPDLYGKYEDLVDGAIERIAGAGRSRPATSPLPFPPLREPHAAHG
jgi:hypothetical protein